MRHKELYQENPQQLSDALNYGKFVDANTTDFRIRNIKEAKINTKPMWKNGFKKKTVEKRR
jgi:hypothetical protein